jgi:glycosyltransferase involved in cell wall biosynthesis
VDRHVRDISGAVARPHLLWHVGERAEVLETAGAHRFLPLDPARVDAEGERVAGWLRARDVGLVHLHSSAGAARMRAQRLRDDLKVPLILTLHDVTFLRPDAFDFDDPRPDPQWTGEVATLARRADAVLAPSTYIADLARTHLGVSVEVVPNGLAHAPIERPGLQPRPDFLARRPKRVAAVLGAVGEHKGAELLRELPRHLEGSGIGVVVIGYLDRQLYPAWAEGGGLYVHGPYRPDDAAALLAAYGAEVVLFPNHAPESFSYSLSEAWAAGLPVLAGPRGAIGERVRRHGGGWLLSERFDAAEVAGRLRSLLGESGEKELAQVKSALRHPDPDRVPTLQSMAQSLEAYYRRYGAAAAPASGEAPSIEALLAPSLDATLFRSELAHLADLCDADGEGPRHAREFRTEAKAWIAKLEADVRDLQGELRREFAERTRLADELARLDEAASLVRRMPRWMRRVLAAIARRA